MKCAVNKVNCLLEKIDIRDFTELIKTIYAAAVYVSELVRANKLPKTKKTLVEETERKLKELSRDLHFLNNLLENRNIKNKHNDP